ncbi:MAG: DUF4936 family protein [Rhodocyclaceae bacterium]|jgi:hypothetical protein
MISSVYIYYCVAPDKTQEARSAVLGILETVKTATGVQGRVMCRLEDAKTWMEVYEPVDDPNRLLDIIERAAAESDLMKYLLHGTRRHIEPFVPLDAR